MKPVRIKREGGAALLAVLAVIMLAASWFLVSQLNAESGGRSAVSRTRNAEALLRAKLGLTGYIVAKAIDPSETNPGRLPCPEAAGNIDGTNDGISSGNCTLPAVGRFPWRTLGMEKLVDAANEPLWYVVSPGWALSNSTTPPLTTYINSNSYGQLLVNAKTVSALSQSAGTATAVSAAHGFNTGDVVKIAGASPAGYNVAAVVTVTNVNTFTYAVDSALAATATGQIKAGNSAVALIVAPGQALNVSASTNCAARNQTRRTPDSSINALDYLECYDTANSVFSTTGPSGSFNNQVLAIAASDIMPAIEGAIANRIERDIVPALNSVYTSANWGVSGSKPVYPYPAQFANPGPGTGSSNYWGASANCVAGVCKGLLPFNEVQGCTVATSNPRCIDPATVFTFSKPGSYVDTAVAGSGSVRTSSNSSTCVLQSSKYVCTGEYLAPSISVAVSVNVTYVAMGLRSLDTSQVTCTAVDDAGSGDPVKTVACSVSAALQNDGSAKLTVTTSALPDIVGSGWGTYANYKISIDRAVISDHALLDTSDATTGWFARNEWYRLVYYAVAQGHMASTLPPSCTTAGAVPATACLSIANVTVSGAQRAILILAGRSINGTARPSSTLANYLEFGNATAAFERQPVSVSTAAALKKPFNDRIVVVGSN